MNNRRTVTACVLLVGLSCACTAQRARESQIPSVEEFPARGDQLLLELSQFGDRIHSVEGQRLVLFASSGADDACTNPPRPTKIPPTVNPVSLDLALAALRLMNENRSSGKPTVVDKCRPVTDS